MTAPFGGSAGLLQRLRPQRVDVADLREVAGTVLPALSTSDLRVRLVQRPRGGSVVVLEEHERCVQTPLGELADDMTAAGVRPTAAGIAAALSAWVAHRPVTDAAAAGTGIAVLDWTDAARTAVGWRVVVRRGALTVPWTADPAAEPAIHRIRSAATGRAHDVVLDLRVEGPVALWSHAAIPVLATAALVDPERMLRRIAAVGLVMADMYVVVTPHRPVACADQGVAARLAGETTETSVTLPWQDLADLPWI